MSVTRTLNDINYQTAGLTIASNVLLQGSFMLMPSAITTGIIAVSAKVLLLMAVVAKRSFEQYKLFKANIDSERTAITNEIKELNIALCLSVKSLLRTSLIAIPLIKLAKSCSFFTQRLHPLCSTALVGRVWAGYIAIKSIYDIAKLAFHAIAYCFSKNTLQANIHRSQIRNSGIELYNNARTMLYTAIFSIPIIGLPMILFALPERAGEAFGAILGESFAINSLAQNLVYPLRSALNCEHLLDWSGRKLQQKHFDKLRKISSESPSKVQIETADKRILHAIWKVAPNASKSSPTAILFHGNSTTAERHYVSPDGKKTLGSVFEELGINTLSVTLGGYPGTIKQEQPTSELIAMQDATAAVKWVEEKGVTNILAFGHSIGGHQAMSAGYHHPRVHVMLSNTLANVKSVALRLLSNMKIEFLDTFEKEKGIKFSLKFLELNFTQFIQSTIEGTLSTVFRPGVTSDGIHYKDGFDNANKAKTLKGRLFVICPTQDAMMGNSDANCESTLIVNSYNKHHPDVDPIAVNITQTVYQQNHDTVFWETWGDNKAVVLKFLREIGMIQTLPT